MVDRIIGALTFRKGVYAEVERDQTFTQSAFILVILVAFLNRLGGTANIATIQGFGSWMVAAGIGTIFSLIGFIVSAFIISWVGKAVFSARVDFNEMVRVLGLAYIWNAVGFLGILAIISSALTCILSPISIIAAILGLIAWLLAVKEALDLDWFQTIITIIIGWIAGIIIGTLADIVLRMFGIASSGISNMFFN
jgi:hypothetical protein